MAHADLVERARAGLRVLVVDDAPEMTEMLAVLLEAAGHGAVCAVSGPDALARLGREPFDVVITDSAMPGVAGDALAVEVKRLRPARRSCCCPVRARNCTPSGTCPRGSTRCSPSRSISVRP